MADTREFLVLGPTGAPLLDAEGAFTVTAYAKTGGARTPPTVVHKGQGVYRFTVTDADETVGTVVHIDTGAGNVPRRHTLACYLPTRENQFWAVHVENPDGTVWAGPGTAVVGSYRDAAGNTRSAPFPVTITAFLFSFVPTADDIAVDVSIRVDGPGGSAQTYWLGQTQPVVVPTTTVIGPAWLPGTPVVVPAPSTSTEFARESYLRLLKSLLPPGRLFDLRPESNNSRLLEGIADELTRINARGGDLLDEADPRTAVETLPDWERVLALPDDLVTEIPATTADRQVAVAQKYAARGGQTQVFFEHLFARAGYVLEQYQLFHSLVLRTGFRVNQRVYGAEFAYSVLFYYSVPVGAKLTVAELERVVRAATHAHIKAHFQEV